MERGDWTWIAHEGIDFMGPYGERHLERLFHEVDLRPGARVLDAGCGAGALLAWLAARGPIEGSGVDLRPPRRGVPGVRFVSGDVTQLSGDGDFDLACSIGAALTPERLARFVHPGGMVLFGGGYWRRRPSRSYLAALGAERDELASWGATVAAGDRFGLELLRAVRSTTADWDRYEDAWAANGERYAAEHPGEPGMTAFRDWIHGGRRRYRELGGRATLGFGLLLWRRR